ncbi:Uncharacterized protein Fot_04367 [Forsythia ovata]|uniref:Stomatal closure-related actin-binding protein actin-binding domain-containing protein n=1 Tax=Forsythia ovata TaxID=205694 RepID=A0ABD1XFE5_9LAMI
MYDATGVRLHAGRLAEVLNQIVCELPSEHPLAESRPLCELLGHTHTQVQYVLPVSADVSFASNQFPKYKLGPDNEILDEVKEDIQGPSLKEVVVEETNQLTEQHKRLSVRDLDCKFGKNLSAAAKLSEAGEKASWWASCGKALDDRPNGTPVGMLVECITEWWFTATSLSIREKQGRLLMIDEVEGCYEECLVRTEFECMLNIESKR